MDSDSESKLISLISKIMSFKDIPDTITVSDKQSVRNLKVMSLIIQTISLVRSMDLDPQPKPETKLMSLVTQTISLFSSIDLYSQPKPLSELISLISNAVDSDSKLYEEFMSLARQSWRLEPEPELMTLIHQIIFLATSMSSYWKKLISLSPQLQVAFRRRKDHDIEEIPLRSLNKWNCLPLYWTKFGSREGEEDATHFLCQNCYGKNHGEYEKAPLEVKHRLHPKHSLRLVLFEYRGVTKECYCCDEDLEKVFYYCSACDFAMNIACVEKRPPLAIEDQKWHEHTLVLFPSRASLPCDLCALTRSTSCPFYICPTCDFVAHQSCLRLPRLIRISRHLHRISFKFSFGLGNWSCGICRRKIDNNYGGYSCIKDGCSYAAHSKCATQSNVWDGEDLEGKPEEIEEEIAEPFVRISDGIIEHFSHQHHHLRLDENTGRDYNEDKLCQVCITPIYFGNFYSCMQCEFILHEKCANLSRKIHHPVHPHMLTLALVGGKVDVEYGNECSACPYYCTAGFFYECGKEGCPFKLHVQCATISEPLKHGSHMHPLFLTSKPGELRYCSVCNTSRIYYTNETFNCIKPECDFGMCFKCATIPEKVRYKHDKHILTLSYGQKETSHKMNWCEACEGKIKPKERFYTCDEYCCVTLHIKCLIGEDLYMKPGSSWFYKHQKVDVLPNNHHKPRPFCSGCKKRSPHRIVYQLSGKPYCSYRCLYVYVR